MQSIATNCFKANQFWCISSRRLRCSFFCLFVTLFDNQQRADYSFHRPAKMKSFPFASKHVKLDYKNFFWFIYSFFSLASFAKSMKERKFYFQRVLSVLLSIINWIKATQNMRNSCERRNFSRKTFLLIRLKVMRWWPLIKKATSMDVTFQSRGHNKDKIPDNWFLVIIWLMAWYVTNLCSERLIESQKIIHRLMGTIWHG